MSHARPPAATGTSDESRDRGDNATSMEVLSEAKHEGPLRVRPDQAAAGMQCNCDL